MCSFMQADALVTGRCKIGLTQGEGLVRKKIRSQFIPTTWHILPNSKRRADDAIQVLGEHAIGTAPMLHEHVHGPW